MRLECDLPQVSLRSTCTRWGQFFTKSLLYFTSSLHSRASRVLCKKHRIFTKKMARIISKAQTPVSPE